MATQVRPEVRTLGRSRSAPLIVQIERRGVFEVGVSGSDARQCGRRGIRKVRYTVRITGDDQHLTAEGFLIDNHEIHAYFENKYSNVADMESCEHIASAACRDFKAMFGRGHLQNVRVSRIEVQIGAVLAESPEPVAGITALWERRPLQRVTR